MPLANQLLQAELAGAQLSDLHTQAKAEVAHHRECGGLCAEDCDGAHLDAAAQGGAPRNCEWPKDHVHHMHV